MINDSRMLNQSSSMFNNHATRTCVLNDYSEESGIYIFTCTEYHYNFAILTLVFIYLPSTNTVSSMMGPDTAPKIGCLTSVLLGLLWLVLDVLNIWTGSLTAVVCGKLMFYISVAMLVSSVLAGGRYGDNDNECCKNFGYWMFLLGLFIVLPIIGILNIPGVMSEADETWELGQYLLWIPGAMIGLGCFLLGYTTTSATTLIFDVLCFIILYIFSPVLFLFIKLMLIIRPENEFIIKQTKMISRGEVILESTPQMCLQLYIIFTTLSASWTQWFSICTSTASIIFSLLDKFMSFNQESEKMKDKIKEGVKLSLIFLTNALFRILSVVVMFLFFRGVSVFIIAGSVLILFISFFIMLCFNIDGGGGQDQEYFFLTWLTITNLHNTPAARFYRTLGFYYNLTLNLILLITVLILNSVTDDVWTPGAGYWRDLAIVQESFYLHLTVGVTLGCGLMSLVLDLIFYYTGLGSVFNEGWKVWNEIKY